MSDSTFVETLSQNANGVQKVQIEVPKATIVKPITATKKDRARKTKIILSKTQYAERFYNVKNSNELQLLANSINRDIKNMADVSIAARKDLLNIWMNEELLKLLRQKNRPV